MIFVLKNKKKIKNNEILGILSNYEERYWALFGLKWVKWALNDSRGCC